MNKTTAYLLAATLLGGFVSTTTGCAALIEAGVDAAYESSEEKHIRRDNRHLRRGQPLRYHKDEQELRERERMRRMRERGPRHGEC